MFFGGHERLFNVLYSEKVLDFVQEKKWAREKRLLKDYVHGFNARMGGLFASFVYAAMTTDWPMDAFAAA